MTRAIWIGCGEHMKTLLREFIGSIVEADGISRSTLTDELFGVLKGMGKPLAPIYLQHVVLSEDELSELLVHLDYVQEHAGENAGDPGNKVWTSGPVYQALSVKVRHLIDALVLLEPGYVVSLNVDEEETLWQSYIHGSDLIGRELDAVLDHELNRVPSGEDAQIVVPVMLGDVSGEIEEMVEDTFYDDEDEYMSPASPTIVGRKFFDAWLRTIRRAARIGGKR